MTFLNIIVQLTVFLRRTTGLMYRPANERGNTCNFINTLDGSSL